MKRFINAGRILALTTIAVASLATFGAAPGQDRHAVPRDGDKQDSSRPREPDRRPPDDGQRRAQPRPDNPRGDRDRPAPERRQPPRAAGAPRHYAFSPVDVHVRYYYHPYFGFYFGPYYGPYYPGPGYAFVRFNEGALRLRVKPVDTEVYVNGYYAGVVNDFDGVFQRLYLPRGEHVITLHLPGYEPHTIAVRVRRGETIDIFHDMRRLAAGRPDPPPPTPRPLPREWIEPPAAGEDAPSEYGVLALRTEPPDAQIFVDGEAWAPVAGQAEFVIHLTAGWHQVEARRDGYRPFSMRVELIEGQTTRLDAHLER